MDFFFHFNNPVLIVHNGYAGLMELLFAFFPITHDAGGLLFPKIMNERLQTEIQEIITCDDEKIIIQSQLINCKLNIPDCSQSGFIAFCSVIKDGNRQLMVIGPRFKVMCKLMVAYDDVLVNNPRSINVLQKPVKDRLVLNL